MSLGTTRRPSQQSLPVSAVSNFAADMAVKQAWGLSLTQWDRAPESDRRYWRDNVTSAPYFNQEGPR